MFMEYIFMADSTYLWLTKHVYNRPNTFMQTQHIYGRLNIFMTDQTYLCQTQHIYADSTYLWLIKHIYNRPNIFIVD